MVTTFTKRMSDFWKWITGRRNECTVTYSRFGIPGDVLDDRPPPSTIFIAQFDDNDPKFMFFKLCHAQKAALAVAGIVFLFLYLGIGILVHYQVIAGIKKQASYYLLPFIVSYIVAMNTEMLLIFFHMVHIQALSLNYALKEESNAVYLFSIIMLLITILFQGFMLKAVCQCRQYLSCKEIHLTALKVAESSRTKYPGIRVVFASQTFNENHPVNITNGNRVADGGIIEQGINSSSNVHPCI
ncbi:hypothetical protein X798_00046 [Onchocerca flexuosa]|uniref:Uncharacterized protein n=1 Tax=Onchocerca flexuosa TaxID=387005 RepID=A0A238C5J6_9BILA|nr:hypothetical protein X798_00046 [Onchocerca flexuosa]